MTRMGLPIIGWVVNPTTFLLAYVVGAIKFFASYKVTSYSNKLPVRAGLTAIWPLAFAINKTFRAAFLRALRN